MLLGDQLEILKKQIKLKCDWKVSSYSITPLILNESKYDWEKANMHLMGHPNSSQMIYNLQQEIKETFTKGSPDRAGTDVIESLVDNTALFNCKSF